MTRSGSSPARAGTITPPDPIRKFIQHIAASHRKKLVVGLHLIAAAVSYDVAFLLRFDGQIPPALLDPFLKMLPVVLACRILALRAFGLHQGFWRYTDVRDALYIGWATLTSSLAAWGASHFILGYPHPVLILDGLIFILMLSGLRLLRRAYTAQARPDAAARRVLIFGAGDAGEMVARDMMKNTVYNRRPVAFIDDDPQKKGMRLRHIPVAGNRADLAAVASKFAPDEVLIAIPSASQSQIKTILHQCKSLGLPIRTLAPLADILAGKARATDIRNLEIEDVLGRPEITEMNAEVAATIHGAGILITGAGGSIGSELCRQVAALKPGRLILFEQSENNLHHIRLEILRRFPDLPLEAVLGDILDVENLDAVFSRFSPKIVLHAAAYKHVPMMEMHPLEAVRNNILGTCRVMEAACRHHAERFVLISTDKAVSPTSVMGATKRMAEMLARHFHERNGSRIVAVRFGNVLESSGSVVPLFREQIKKGGPVTLTHPDITRYFITIGEAVRLVLHAMVLGEGGETFVLDMGEPIRIADLAHLMILLSGLAPEKDIAIQYVGLRPGEKLTERMFEEDEVVLPTRHARIRQARYPPASRDISASLAALFRMDHSTDRRLIEAVLREWVPTYRAEQADSF